MAEFTDRFPFDTNKISAYAVPQGGFTGSANSVVTKALPAGKYMIGYSFEVNFNGHKDKAIEFRLTGTYAGDIFAETAPTKAGDDLKNRYYMFPKDVSEGTIVDHGIEFNDPGAAGITVAWCDVMCHRVS